MEKPKVDGNIEGSTNAYAFCPLLWRRNGGPVDGRGFPVISEGKGTRGKCDRPYDCNKECVVMDAVLEALVGEIAIWVCPDCVPKAKKGAEWYGITMELQSYYGEGLCQRPSCEREDHYSPILQLLLVTGNAIP